MSQSTILVLIVTAASAAAADEPRTDATKPPYERLLQGDDAKQAAELTAKIEKAQQADQYDSAIEHDEELLALRTRVQGTEHWEAVNARWSVVALRRVAALAVEEREAWRAARRNSARANALIQQGHYAEAQPLEEKALELQRKVQGEDHPHTATTYNNVAWLMSKQGKCAEAQPLFEKALEIDRSVLGEEHPDTAYSYEYVAMNLSEQGKYAEAQPLLEKALGIIRKVLGEEHSETSHTYNSVAINLSSQGKYAEAQPLLEKALEIGCKVQGEDSHQTATMYRNIADNLDHQAKYTEAERLYQKALEITRKVLGEDHPNTAMIYHCIAGNLDSQGEYAEAQPVHQKALEIGRKVLGEEHPFTAASYNGIALNLHSQGKYAEAQPLYQKALEIRRKVLGEEHPSTAQSYGNVAAVLDEQGKYAEAQLIHHKALEISRKVLGEDHPDTATSYNNLAYNLQRQGKYAEAQPLLEKALEITRKVLGEDHPSTATSYNNLAYNLNEQGEYSEAEPLYQEALEIRRKVLGENHPDTVTSYNNVAGVLDDQGKYAEAEPLLQKALEINRKALGEGHSHTVGIYGNVAANLHAQEKFALARDALRLATATYEAMRLRVSDRGLERATIGSERTPYPLQAAAEARAGRAREAWQALESDLARGLLDEGAGRRGAALTDDEARERTGLLSRLDELQPRILALVTRPDDGGAEEAADTATEMELAELIQRREVLERRLIDLAVVFSRREIAALDELQATLPADGALVAWVDVSRKVGGVNEHWGCVVGATGEPAWTRLPGTGPEGQWTEEDDSLPRRLREALAEGAKGEAVQALADELSRQRLKPLAEHLKDLRRVFIVGANLMAGIPVEALTDQFTVSYVPSGTFLARLSDRSPASEGGLLAVGDPVFSRSDSDTKPTPAADLPPGGLVITQVVPGGAADKARLKANDVLVRYGDAELDSVDQLAAAMQAQADAKEVPITVWREGVKQPFTRNVPPGKLGVALSKESAREAIANRRDADAILLAMRGGTWDDLPGTRAELTQLAKLFGQKATTLVDSAASEQALEELRNDDDTGLSQFRYLHFATHGEANDVRAFESVLILAQDTLPPDPLPRAGEPFINGQLSANEVMEFWHLNADLVTLSACETALGRKGGGDGLLGFAQAFLKAGSRAVCLSLWKVDDTATSLLMGRLYQNLLGKRPGLKGPMPKAAALAEAKEWLRELSAEEALTLSAAATNGVVRGTRGKGEKLKLAAPAVDAKQPGAKEVKPFAHPRFWSAFILIGDPN